MLSIQVSLEFSEYGGSQMMMVVSIGIAVLALFLSVPITILFVEVIASFAGEKNAPSSPKLSVNKRIAVVVPAHNESIGIVPTLEDIKPQLQIGDRLFVVADNCTDDTANVAECSGASVILRDDPNNVGKGYALGYAIDLIRSDPPDFIVFVDADCRLEPNAIKNLKDSCDISQRPTQACYLMKSPENSPIDHSFAEFAFLLRNWIRPLGLSALNCPVQLMGTGMIFPWKVINAAPLASGHLVEDLKLGLDLATAGSAPRFLPSVKVTSDFPLTAKGTDSQRQRWVQGHLGMIGKRVPMLFSEAIKRNNLELLALAIDLMVPPLSLLGLMTVAILALAGGLTLCGASSLGFLIASINFGVLAITLVMAWVGFGRKILPARKLLSLGTIVFKKVGFYIQMLIGRTAIHWVRTDRGKD